MSLRRLQRDEAYRFYLASPLAFANWQTPTAAELNANPTNNPNGLLFNLTCALSQEDTQFDLDDPDLDESLTFCQSAGNTEVYSRSATVVFTAERAKQRWTPATSTSAVNGFNTANLAFSLLAWRGIDYFAILSVGADPDAPFAIDDRVKMAEVSTDWGLDLSGTGESIRLQQTFAKRSKLNWNFRITA
jgi:hypothetical protein